MSNAASRVLSAAIAVSLMVISARADAAMVSGVYTSRGGTPLADHQLHFENRISRDIFLTRTGSDGSFSADLPPGTYDLRTERGLNIKENIVVDGSEVSVGRVPNGGPLDVLSRLFERQGIAPSLVDTDAPATAHLSKSPAEAPSSVPTAAQASASGSY